MHFSNVPVWDMRPVQTLSVTHPFPSSAGPGMPVETDLRLSQGRIRGRVVNHTSHTVRDLRLLAVSGTQARLAEAAAGLPLERWVAGSDRRAS